MDVDAVIAIPVRFGMTRLYGKLDGRTGRQKFICARCHMKGKITVLE